MPNLSNSTFEFNIVSTCIDTVLFAAVSVYMGQKQGLFIFVLIRTLFSALPLMAITYSVKSFFKVKQFNGLIISYVLTYIWGVILMCGMVPEAGSIWQLFVFYLFDREFFLLIMMPFAASFVITMAVRWTVLKSKYSI